MDNNKIIQELEKKFLALKTENEKRFSEAKEMLHKAELQTEKRVRLIYTLTIPIFAILSFGIIAASFIFKT